MKENALTLQGIRAEQHFMCVRWHNLEKNSQSDKVPSANFHVNQLS